MRRTKIICTLGPSSNSAERIRALIEAGMDVARLNFSHGTHEAHEQTFHIVREAAVDLGKNVAIMADLQGPKIRTGRLQDGKPVELKPDAAVSITTEDVPGTADRLSTTYGDLPHDVTEGDRILIADGTLELTVEQVDPPAVHCRVVHGGTLGEHKGINLPGVAVSAPCLTEKDLDDLQFAMGLGADYVALSFVREPDDIWTLKRIIEEAGRRMGVVAKIERPEAIEQFEEILALTDAVMVARGDLGVEVPLDQIPQIQKDLITRCNQHGVPVVTATQMLESMMTRARPTRAEVNDVANAIYDGTDAVMLSGETAAGAYPVQAVEVMARIAEQADDAIARSPRRHIDDEQALAGAPEFSNAIGHAVYHISESLPVRRVVCFTSSGYTAAMIARYRPRVPVSAFTLTEEARRRCALFWGVEAAHTIEVHSIDEMVALLDRSLIEDGLVEEGDTIVLVAGTPLAVEGRTNLLKLHTVGDRDYAAG